MKTLPDDTGKEIASMRGRRFFAGLALKFRGQEWRCDGSERGFALSCWPPTSLLRLLPSGFLGGLNSADVLVQAIAPKQLGRLFGFEPQFPQHARFEQEPQLLYHPVEVGTVPGRKVHVRLAEHAV